jgi:hypothetical protein
MSMTMRDEGGNLFRFELRGLVRRADFERCEQELKAQIARVGPVKVLFVLDGFTGWHPTDRWGDMSFYVTHGDNIQRMAIVGDERWRSETLMFAGADLRKAPVKFFSTPYATLAQDWLAGG